jgi:hypothetical protein
MDLVNEYLRAVAALLPKAQRDDIIAELRDTILSQIEEREAELGRPLTDDEVEALLREVGHPVVIAARYSDGPQHVVGPTLYPYWLFAVKAAIVLQVAIALIVVLVRTLAFGNFSLVLGQAIGSGVTGVLVLIGAATCAAWFIERRGARIDYLDKWRVRDLRYLEIVAWDFSDWRDWFARNVHDPKGRPRRHRGTMGPDASASARAAPSSSSSIEATGPMAPMPPMPPMGPRPAPWHPAVTPVGRGLGFLTLGVLLILWWTGVLPLNLGLSASDWATLDIDPGAFAKVNWMGLRAMLFWPVLAYAGVFLLQGIVMLAYPWAVRLQGLLEAGKGAALLTFCVWIWTASPLAAAVGVISRPEFAARMSMLRQSPPLPVEPIATIVVLSVGFTACALIGRGLWSLVFGAPAGYREMPPHRYSRSAM